MKPIIPFLTAAGLSVLNFTAFSQKDSSGIYLTADDFKNQKLSYAINYKTEKHKINAYLFLDGTKVRVKHHDTIYMLDKSETYGYKSAVGETFRFVNGVEYKILNPGEEILIYEHSDWLDPLKSPTKRSDEHYYFSKDAFGAPAYLTIENLKKAYKDNSKFHALINKYFKNDEELTSYDSKRKIYTVNRLLQLSNK